MYIRTSSKKIDSKCYILYLQLRNQYLYLLVVSIHSALVDVVLEVICAPSN